MAKQVKIKYALTLHTDDENDYVQFISNAQTFEEFEEDLQIYIEFYNKLLTGKQIKRYEFKRKELFYYIGVDLIYTFAGEPDSFEGVMNCFIDKHYYIE